MEENGPQNWKNGQDTVVLNGHLYNLAPLPNSDEADVTNSSSTKSENRYIDHHDHCGSPVPQSSTIETGSQQGTQISLTVPLSQVFQVDHARGLLCMKVGDTVYQVPLCNVTATGDLPKNDNTEVDPNTSCRTKTLPEQETLVSTTSSALFDATKSFPLVENEICVQELVSTAGTSVTNTIEAPLKSEPMVIDLQYQKKKGGWPKGKKRKQETIASCVPKAPSTGYCIFAREKRKSYNEANPHLNFAEITRILGNAWSVLPSDIKEQYLERAKEDKERYKTELKEYQGSEAYLTYVKKRRLKKFVNITDTGALGNISNADMSDEDEGQLHCKLCDKYFSSEHNKQEHMLGKQHLTNIKGQFETELEKETNRNVTVEPTLANTAAVSPIPTKPDSNSIDVDNFLEVFMLKNYEREAEIKELKLTLAAAKLKQTMLCKDIIALSEQEERLKQMQKCLKAYNVNLNTVIDSLKMVPTLFGVINF